MSVCGDLHHIIVARSLLVTHTPYDSKTVQIKSCSLFPRTGLYLTNSHLLLEAICCLSPPTACRLATCAKDIIVSVYC